MPKYTEKQLLKAVQYSKNNPDIPLPRIAALYNVTLSTLRRRKLGLTLPPSKAHRGEQLFSPGEEQAIVNHCITMADLNFPLSHDILHKLAQDILNSRAQPTTKPRKIGEDWVGRFLKRNPNIRTKFVRYQERSRLAVSNNIELQLDFLKQLANLVRRIKVQEQDIWNCDEKGITIGRQSMKTKAIVRAGISKAIAGCDGNREFVSVLETVNAAGEVIPPFIVWTGNIHTESYYPSSSKFGGYSATFAVSKNGYMDNELGMGYMKTHFEPHTRRTTIVNGEEVVRTRLLIVDGHSSHINYHMLSWALDMNIHVICLPSKSTHILQPLDVGCFGLLQRTYEHNLRDWITANPLGLVNKIAFLEVLYKTREEVYTSEVIKSAWKASKCWPIDIELARRALPIGSSSSAGASSSAAASSSAGPSETNVSDIGNSTNPIGDTVQQLRQLERNVKNELKALPITYPNRKDIFDAFYAYVDKSEEKLFELEEIAPRANTINALRNGKAYTGASRRRHIPGATRIMTNKVITEGLAKLKEAEEKRLEKEHLKEKKKKDAEDKRNAKLRNEQMWRLEKTQYEIQRGGWEMECRRILDEWNLARDAARVAKMQNPKTRIPKKPKLPPPPKKPTKSSFVVAGDTSDEGNLDEDTDSEVDEGMEVE